MALRVLLADESSTIKRVMQLALQDYAVEVKSVPIGIDVLSVAKSFQPDLIFADVLLPKRSGYDVCKDLKLDPETKKIPLVLMWSGFMELDETKAQEARADRRLEKPFEPETLRQLVQDLVKKTQDNPLSEYLTFPEMPEITEEDFSQVPLHGGPKNIAPTSHSSQEEWSRQSLGQISIKAPEVPSISAVEIESVDPEKYMIPENDLQKPHIEAHGDFEEVTFVKPPAPKAPKPSGSEVAFHGLDALTAEQILRDEARQVIENIAWKIIPEIAERIVREEINKLLQESEKSI